MALVLDLVEMRNDEVIGIVKYGGRMPARARYLHPAAATSYRKDLHPHGIVISDMFRTPESSLAAVRANRGAQRPGYSGHNFGLSIDVDVTAFCRSLFNTQKVDKTRLDLWMESKGWFCHRRDHRREIEEWHYNFFGIGTIISPKVRSTSGYLEAKIVEIYGPQLLLDSKGAQVALKKMSFYSGEIDGQFGPISRSALIMFQKSVDLAATGKLDERTQRTLAYVTCEKRIVSATPFA